MSVTGKRVVLRLHPGPQKKAYESRATEILYGGAAGGGKALQNQELIATPFGFRAIGDLKVGESVIGADGCPTKVIAVYPQGVRPIYRVTFQDGASVDCDEDHLWQYSVARKGKWRKSGREWKVATTLQMAEMIEAGRTLLVPLVEPVKFTRSYRYDPRTIDPWVVGALIGDGCLTQRVAFCSADREIIDRMAATGEWRVSERNESFWTMTCPDLRPALEKLELFGKGAADKFIPWCYKTDCVEARWELLRGLMDTDGTVSPDGKLYFTTISERLAKDVKFLVGSLGGTATITDKWPTYTHEGEKLVGQKAYTLYIRLNDGAMAFSLTRKKARCNVKRYKRRIVSIEHVGEGQATCITVDNPDGLFVATKDFIVTHNSHLLRVTHLAAALAMPGYQGFIYRSTSDELRMNHLVGPTSMPEMCLPWINAGFCTYHIQQMTFTFQNGAVIRFRHLGDDRKLGQAQGPDIHQLSVDELTHFDENRYRWLRGRLRCQVPIPRKFPWKLPRAISGTNPGSQGHAWVKHSFIDGCEPYETRLMPPEEGGLIRQYIPARVRDNPSIDPEQYEAALSGLGTPELVRAMRDGDWDIAVGARFAHVWSDHVMVDPFTIPRSWRLVRSFDWGSAKPFSYGLWAISNGDQPYDENLPFFPPGTMVRIAEWYGWTGRPDEGIRMQAKEVGRRIRRLEEKLGYYGRIQPGGADSACFTRERDQKSVHDDLASAGVRFRPVPKGSGSRVAGWRVLDDMLAATRDGNVERPRIYAFKSCHQFRRLIPIVASDPHDPEDVDTKAEDHLPDEVRYAVSMRVGGTRIVRPGGV